MAITDRIESMYNHTGEAYAMVEEKGGNVLNPLGHNLPDEYQEVDYIETNKYGNYIDTGIAVNSNHSIEVDYQVMNTFSENTSGSMRYSMVAGAYNPTLNIGIAVGTTFGSTGLTLRFDGKTFNVPVVDLGKRQKNKHNKTGYYIDDNLIQEWQNTTEFTSQMNIYLFTSQISTGLSAWQNNVRVFSAKIEENNIPIAYFIPCFRKVDNVYGMYDIIRNQFFKTTNTTGEFIGGVEIPKYLDKNLENLSQAISTIDTHTTELEDMRAEMQKPTLNVFSNVMSDTAYAEYVNALKDYSIAFYQYMNYNSNEEVGTSEVKLENALSTNALNVSVKGNNVQDTSTGKNKMGVDNFNPTNCIINSYGNGEIVITSAGQKARAIEDNIPIKENTEYTFNCKFINSNSSPISVQVYGANGKVNRSVESSATTGNLTIQFNSNIATTLSVRLFSNTSTTENNYQVKFYEIMLEEGSQATEYEPYTGGIQAPNPSYPQEIKTLSEGKVVVDQNIFSKDNIEQGAFGTEKKNYYDSKQTNLTRIRVINPMPIIMSTPYKIEVDFSKYEVTSSPITDDNIVNGTSGWKNTPIEYTPVDSSKIAVAVRKKDQSNITPDEIDDVKLKIIPQPNKTTEIDLPLHSKNLFDKTNVSSAYIDVNGNVIPATGSKVSSPIKLKGVETLYRTSLNNTAFYDKEMKFISRLWSKKLAVPTNAEYVRIEVTDSNLDKEQLEEGTQATDYEPYFAHELTSQDTLNIGYDGNTHIEKKRGKVVLTGDETYTIGNSFSYSILKNDIPNANLPEGDITKAISSHFLMVGSRAECVIGTCWIGGSYLNFNYNGISTNLAGFKDWLKSQYNAGTPVTIYYELATPQTIELENTQIPLLPDTNNISVESNVEPTELKVKYAVDIFSEDISASSLMSEVAENE